MSSESYRPNVQTHTQQIDCTTRSTLHSVALTKIQQNQTEQCTDLVPPATDFAHVEMSLIITSISVLNFKLKHRVNSPEAHLRYHYVT